MTASGPYRGEQFSLERGYAIPAHLPGHGPPENCFAGAIDFIPTYEVGEYGMWIDDPVWGLEFIGKQPGDEVLVELAQHDAVKRLQLVEQLTLPPFYSTIPNAAGFSRWEHSWGSVVLVRRLARQHNLAPDAALTCQLRTFLSDIGHTAGSHLGDWVFQGIGGTENHHDIGLEAYLEQVGITDILRKHGIKPQNVIFPDVHDWVESSSPDLCIDRLDYAMREIRRWVPISIDLRLAYRDTSTRPEFIIDAASGRLLMTDPALAEEFADAYMALSREHWNEPVNRLQIALLIERVKRLFIDEHGTAEWLQSHPGDVLFSADNDYEAALQEHDPFGQTLDTIMKDIARFERNTGWHRRSHHVEAHLRGSSSRYMDDYPPHHPMLRIEEALPGQEVTDEKGCLTIALPPLKARYVDPPVRLHNGSTRRVSELSPRFAARLAEHKIALSKTHVARIAIADPRTEQMLREGLQKNAAEWGSLLKRTRMTSRQLQAHIGRAAWLARS